MAGAGTTGVDMNLMRRKFPVHAVPLVALAVIVSAVAGSQYRGPGAEYAPEAEFHMARLIYQTAGCAGSRGWCNPWWAVDYPEAELNFLPALRRYTNLSVADDSRHLPATDDRIFDYPWLFVQQVGRGNWRPTTAEVERLREYLLRGGFIVFDDFHGEPEWRQFESVMSRILPEYPIIDLPEDDLLMTVFFELNQQTPIPGERHLRGWDMQGESTWRGIRDAHGRLMVAINFNIDMGDAWEHADDPNYPTSMTALAYRFGVNYVIYAMTR